MKPNETRKNMSIRKAAIVAEGKVLARVAAYNWYGMNSVQR